MKNIIVIGLKLTIICAVAALCLGMVNAVTAPKIAELKKAALADALNVVNKTGIPGEEVITEDKTVKGYYPVKLDNGELKGYILTLKGDGYAGDLKIIANYEKNGKLISSVLMDNQETPGLGKEAEKIEYMDKYKGFGEDSPIPSKKSQLSASDADAIGGATITFAAIGKALDYGSGYVKKLGE